MVDIKKLKGIMAERGMSGKAVAKKMGLSCNTFYARMRNGKFGIEEAYELIEILAIENPSDIFFAKSV